MKRGYLNRNDQNGLNKNSKKPFFKNNFFMGIIVFVILLVALILFLVFSERGLCKGIEDEELLKNCKLCVNRENPIDCKGSAYIDYAILNADLFLCEEIEQEYLKEECLLRVGRIVNNPRVARPVFDELDSGGFESV